MQQERAHSGASAKRQKRLVQGITIGGLRMWNSACASINRGPAHANLKRVLAACPLRVELRCGAVALGRTYPLPPLSSGGALVVPPSLRFHIPLIGRVEDWRAGLGRSLGSLLSRPFVCECSILDHATSPAPSTSHATCGFPALRAPICFTPKLMGPILLGRLSARRVALDRR